MKRNAIAVCMLGWTEDRNTFMMINEASQDFIFVCESNHDLKKYILEKSF